MGFSPEVSRDLLHYALRGVPFSAPGALYVGLHIGDPEDGAAEVGGEFYQRRPVSFEERAGTLQSANSLEFPALSPTAAPVSHYAVYDHPVPGKGRRVFSEAFTGDSRKLSGGETVAVPAGGIVVI
jgi:hypothetical protein